MNGLGNKNPGGISDTEINITLLISLHLFK